MIKRISSFFIILIFCVTLVGCHEHQYDKEVISPTCDEQGYTINTCKCGDNYIDSYVDELGHKYGEWKTTKEPTEEDFGEKQRKCSVCNAVENEQISKLSHKHKYEKTVKDPTCQEGGYTLYKCKCGEEYKNNEKNKINHSYSEWKTVTEATEQTEGLKEAICSMCNDVIQEVIPVLTKQEVHVVFDFNGGKLDKELTVEDYPIARKINLTQYLSYDSFGYQACLSETSSAIYWHYIVLVKSEIEGYYEIKEIVYLNHAITQEYDLVVMWHAALKDDKALNDLGSMYANSSFYVGKLVQFENIPSEKGDCNITMNVLGYSKNSDTMAQIYKEETTLPTLSPKEDCEFLGWRSSIDNQIYTVFPGYYDYTNYIEYTAEWKLIKVTPAERIEYTYLDIVKYLDKIGEINEDIELVNEDVIRETKIEYESSNGNILSSTGKFNRPYEDRSITLTIKISYGTVEKKFTYQFNVKGYKKLENIASSYVYTGYDKLTNEFFDTMDIIYCAFVLIDVDGGFTGVNGTGGNISGTNKTYLNYMKNIVIPQAHKRGGWVVASLGGGGSAYDIAYEKICSDEKKLDVFVKNVINLINEYGFDGIDIDWEIPDNGKTFTKLMEKLYPAVKANNKHHLVTAAIGGGLWQPPKYDLTNSKQYLDYINVMTYNMVSNSGYHHTSLYSSKEYFDKENKVGHTLTSCSIDESVKIYKNSYGVEANQLILGAAFYGMKQTRSSVNGEWKAAGTISYTNIKNSYMNSSNYECFYDTTCQAAYILSKDKLTFISYDNIESVKAKCDYIKKIGAAGIMYWQNGQDTTGDLVGAIKDGLNK